MDCVIMKDKSTNQSRGFGFVKFKDPNCVRTVLDTKPHNLDGRNVRSGCLNKIKMFNILLSYDHLIIHLCYDGFTFFSLFVQIDPKPCTPRGMQPEKTRAKDGWVRIQEFVLFVF